MARSKDALDKINGLSSENDLGRLIRWSLEDSVSAAEPPADVWPRILSRVREMNAPTNLRRWARRSLRPLAPLVQAVVISVLLLAFGLEVNRGVTVSHRPTHSTPAVRRIPTREEQPQDVLRGYILFRMGREPSLRRRGFIPELETVE